ncbi:uncharacterized protein LOC123535979 [Mercenaria mercenaria]|uniref:uncharacterized protein LOC123535979 n=1 Tax=Mercenaria mercenaria TaxID=6596 RepID=UPI00234EDA29|nr:uncharacterized protein LOC123535979 [Mercenaria mercenaria]
MAVSGRKLSDFQGSISLGSEEDFNHSCQPCLTIGQHVGAHGFCVECQEYLCKTCFEYHKRTKALRNHQLLDKDNVGKHAITSKDFEKCTEKCSVHKKEIIKFFCLTHKALGCNDCMILNHRACKIDYIPDKCADIGDSKEYRDIMEKLNEKIKDAEDIMKKAEVRDKEIDKCHAGIIKEILNFRKEINERLDQLQQIIQKDADKKKSSDKIIIQMVLEECANISSDIKKLQSSLQAKSSRQNGHLYINIKRAESKLKSDEVEKADENLARTNIQYSFERNTDLENMLSKQSVLGKLNLSTSFVTSTKEKKIKTLTHKEDITVRTKSDSSSYNCCYITGCVILPSNKLVLVDSNYCKLKVLDRQSKTLIEEKKLDSKPWDIAVLPQNQIAVTVPGNKEILIMKTAGKLSPVHKISVKCNCYDIFYHQDHIYVVCQNPNSVLVLDKQGNVQNTISLNNDIFKLPEYIVVSEDSRHIYISDRGSRCIVSITLQGDVAAVYKDENLRRPQGMVMLDDGSLLVCCYLGGTIHHISGDLKQGQIMIDGVPVPVSICYSHHHDEVYIGCLGDQLKVFGMK